MLTVLAERMRPAVRAQVHWQAVMADVGEHVWRRRLRLRSFRSRTDWEQHVQRTRSAFRAALGPLPDRTPLRVTCTGVLERVGYVVEKLLLETQPDFLVTANLYLPAKRTGQAPGILNPVGHWPLSKAEPVEQARMIALARKGYVALIWDPVGQGERSQFWDGARNASPVPLGTHQHAAVCNPAFLLGSTVIAPMLWDGVRLLDYLISRPEVDPERIACTGVSGGGTYTMFLGAFDDRIRATVPVCSTSSYERMHRQGQLGEPCQDPLGSYLNDLDMADLLMSHAPAALRLLGTRYDAFPLLGLREVALEVQDCYAALGIPEKTDLQVVDAHHDYNRAQRELMYAWFNRWLEHDAPVAEDSCTPEEERTLWCTSTGQCLTSVGGRTVPDLIRALATRLLPSPPPIHTREDAARERARVRQAVAGVLGLIPPLTGAAPIELTPVTESGLLVERLILQARMDVSLPALAFRPDAVAPHLGPLSQGAGPSARRLPVAILLADRGKAAECGEDGLAPALARAGALALAVDLRGWGETAWMCDAFGYGQDRRDLLGADNMLSYVSYMLGHWHVGQRVQDTLGILRYVRSRADIDPGRIFLVGCGGGAIVALHAAALDGAVRGVAVCEALATYRSAVDAPRSTHPVADFLPGVLLHYDLPDLAAALAPARVLILNPQDAVGEPLSPPSATATYARAVLMAGLLDGRLRVATKHTAAARARRVVRWMTADERNGR